MKGPENKQGRRRDKFVIFSNTINFPSGLVVMARLRLLELISGIAPFYFTTSSLYFRTSTMTCFRRRFSHCQPCFRIGVISSLREVGLQVRVFAMGLRGRGNAGGAKAECRDDGLSGCLRDRGSFRIEGNLSRRGGRPRVGMRAALSIFPRNAGYANSTGLR